MPIEITLFALDGALVTDESFVLLVVEPVGNEDKLVFVDCSALDSDPTPLPHPEPQKETAMRKMKNRKNGKLCS
jgi:hypothetical protein